MSTTVDSIDLEIDNRSFHVFEFQGERLLFDRATTTTSVLNDLTYQLLRFIREGKSLEDAMNSTEETFPGMDRKEILAGIKEMYSRGFFRFEEAEPASEEALSELWNHKLRRLQLLMAEGCNLGCRYCYQWRNGTNQKNTLMPWHIARTSVDYLMWRSRGRTDLQVTFFGGEPLLNYEMIQRTVEYCKSIEAHTDRKFTFELITNGTLLTKDVVEFLVEHKFLLFISLDGDHEMHSYNRPSMSGEDLHSTIVQNAQHANAEYEKHDLPRIKVRANLTAKHHNQYKTAKYLESLGFKLIGIGAIEPLPHGDPSPAAMTEDQVDELHNESTEILVKCLEVIKQGGRLSPYLAKTFSRSFSAIQRRSIHGITCGVGRNTTIVDNRGNMYPCHRYAEMDAYQIGNVFTGHDRELLMQYYRKINGHATTSCQDCWIRDYCGGGCAWLLSDSEGHIHDPTMRECNRRRASVERGLWIRKELRATFPERFEGSLDIGASPKNQEWLKPVFDAVNASTNSELRSSPATGCSSNDQSQANLKAGVLLPVLNEGGCGACSADPNSSGGCQTSGCSN